MRLVEGSNHLRIDNDLSVDNQIGHENTDLLPIVKDRKLALLLNLMPTLAKLDDEGILIKLLIQPGLQGIQNRHGRTDD